MTGIVNPWLSGNSDNSSDGITNPWLNTGNSTPLNLTPITADDINGSMASTPAPTPQPNSSPSSFWSWNGVLDNPITHLAGGFAHALGGAFDKVEHLPVLNQITGAMKGLEHGYATFKPDTAPVQNGDVGGIFSKALQNSFGTVGNAIKEGFQGILHPDQARENVQQDIIPYITSQKLPAPLRVANAVAEGMNSPLGVMPFNSFGKGLAKISDAVGATPWINRGIDAVAATKPVQALTDAIGNAFVKDYGASPALSRILQSGMGEHSANQYNAIQSIKDLAQNHGLSDAELNDIGHIIEQTKTGTPAQMQLAQKLSDLMENGAPNSGVGANLLSKTASAVNGDPLLEQKIENYFPHMYDNVPDELKGVFPRQADGVGGLSPTGTYTLPRTFNTLQDAITKGLQPTLNPFHVVGEQLNRMSRAFTNNKIIQQIKDTPGLLYAKDPIDEVAKLVKTGRMDAEDAANQLGMSLEDLQKGFVQSKIPQLRGAYIRPADEAALTEHLQPSKPSGILGGFSKATNLYNKGFLMNPLPHMHNIFTNGVGLGEAKPSYIREAYNAIKDGGSNPFYQRALRAGAVTNADTRNFKDAITAATQATSKNPFVRLKNASHDMLWNSDAAIRTALFRDAVEHGMNDTDAAARTNKFMVNYNNLTPFEKKVVKPVIPFYSWKKGNIPLQASQTFAQSPKYVAFEHAKEAASQAASGQPTDQNGRIQTSDMLPDGSHVAIDPYLPMEDAAKVVNKGPVPWLYNAMNPFLREGIAQGTSALGAFYPKLGLNNIYPIYNSQAPADYNIRKGLAHAAVNLNPFGSSAIAGGITDPNALVNRLFGVQSPIKDDKPNLTETEILTKLLGGFTGRDNPAKDAQNQSYQSRDDAQSLIKYLKDTGQPVTKQLKKDAYRKVAPLPKAYGQ